MSYIVNALKRAFSTSPPTQQQASAGKDLVESLIQSPVAVFSKSYCPYCTEAKHILQKHGQESRMKVVELDHNDNGSAIQSYLAQRIGASKVTVPQVYINGELIGGCSDLKKLQSQGKLDDLLKQ